MADNDLMGAIETLKEKIGKQEGELAERKRTVNFLCAEAGLEPAYSDPDPRPTSGSATLSLKRDQFFGKKLATAITDYMEFRYARSIGPATVDEIFESLKAGGYDGFGKDSEDAKRGLTISLAKNTAKFAKLPNGETFGLASWYPGLRRVSANGKDDSKDSDADQGTQPATA